MTYLANDNPTTRSPRVSEINDEEPDESDGRPTSGLVRGPLMLVDAEEGGDDDVTGSHCQSASDHDGFAAKFVDIQHRGDGSEEHGNTDNTCS